jgi:hypothetical protein
MGLDTKVAGCLTLGRADICLCAAGQLMRALAPQRAHLVRVLVATAEGGGALKGSHLQYAAVSQPSAHAESEQ